jgi:hypothetical protein
LLKIRSSPACNHVYLLQKKAFPVLIIYVIQRQKHLNLVNFDMGRNLNSEEFQSLILPKISHSKSYKLSKIRFWAKYSNYRYTDKYIFFMHLSYILYYLLDITNSSISESIHNYLCLFVQYIKFIYFSCIKYFHWIVPRCKREEIII